MHETVSRRHLWVARIALFFWVLIPDAQQVSKMSTWRFILREKHNFGSIKRHNYKPKNISQRVSHMRISIESWNDRTLLYFAWRQRKGDENYCGNEVCTAPVGARQVCGLDAALAFETIFSCVCVFSFSFQISDFTRLIKSASFGFNLFKISDKTNECLLWT